LSFAQYMAHVDPALDAVIAWSPDRTLAARLRAAVGAGSGEELETVIRHASADLLYKYARVDGQVNAIGYELLRANRIPEALLVLDANARAYPTSANAFDSLGEANERAGNSGAALAAYQRALELNPGLASSQAGVARLKTAQAGHRP